MGYGLWFSRLLLEGRSKRLRCKARDDDRARRTERYAAASVEERNAADEAFSTSVKNMEGAREADRHPQRRIDLRQAYQERGVDRRGTGTEAPSQPHHAGVLGAGVDLPG